MPIFSEMSTLFFNKLRFISCFILVCMFCNGVSTGVVGLAYAENIQDPLPQTLPALESDLWIATYKQLSIEELAQKADAGDAKAQCTLGILYDDGEGGLEQDYAKAKHYFELSAKQANAEAYYKLGKLYYNGTSVIKNDMTAFAYYQLSAMQNNANGIASLAFCYDQGIGVNIDHTKAFHYFSQACNQGNIASCNNVATCYLEGTGTKKDYKKALHYLNLLAKKNNPIAFYNLGIMHENGYGVKLDKNKAQEYFSLAIQYGLDKEEWYSLGLP